MWLVEEAGAGEVALGGNVAAAAEVAPKRCVADLVDACLGALPGVLVGEEPVDDLRRRLADRGGRIGLVGPGTQAELEHVAVGVGPVGLGAVPQAGVEDGHAAGAAGEQPLTPERVVAGEAAVAHPAQVRAGKDERRPHLGGGVGREVQRQEVEGERAHLHHRVLVPGLGEGEAGRGQVDRGVVVARRSCEEADRISDLRHVEHAADHLRGSPQPVLVAPVGTQLGEGQLVEPAVDDAVEQQEPVHAEPGEIDRPERRDASLLLGNRRCRLEQVAAHRALLVSTTS